MKITRQEVEHVATLARLKLDDEEISTKGERVLLPNAEWLCRLTAAST